MLPEKHELTISQNDIWKFAGLIILSIRFVQGWIFWGGGSRRFIYDPSKLDPYSPQWMANKLQSAMPGALLGVGHIVNFLLEHFILLYLSVLIFSLVELVCGLGLLCGFFTRLAGFGTALISVLLMLLFGWQGATCMDEWTMAISNLAMGLTLALSGGFMYSIDHVLLIHRPALAKKWWFLALASGPLSFKTLKRVSILFLIFTIIFTLVTYNYYRGSIITPYHPGPVNPGTAHLALSQGSLNANGSVSFLMYVDSGTPASPSNIIRIEIRDQRGFVVEEWRGKILSQLPAQNIKNIYDYNRIATGFYGLAAPLSAKAEIKLPPIKGHASLVPGPYQLEVYTINGQRFTLSLEVKR